MIIPDGMADWRYPELGNQSPVEYAHTPGMDEVVRCGQIGLAQTMIDGLPLGSLVGILGLLGYNPADYFPLGRSIFEARALGIHIGANDACYRCNIVRVRGDQLLDFTSGQISDQDANVFLDEMRLAPPFEIHHDLSYRNVLIERDSPLIVDELDLHEPHENMGGDIAALLPRYQGQPYQPLIDLMLSSRRGDLMLWPWGPGRNRQFPQLTTRLVTITALSFLAGMTLAVGGTAVMPQGATGYLNTNLDAKFAAAVDYLAEADVCLIHCNAPDEEAHIHSLKTKIQAIEDVDRKVVVPMLRHLETLGEPYRLLLVPDHYTVTGTGKHTADLVPYAVMGTGLQPNHSLAAYSEVAMAAHPAVKKSYNLVRDYSH